VIELDDRDVLGRIKCLGTGNAWEADEHRSASLVGMLVVIVVVEVGSETHVHGVVHCIGVGSRTSNAMVCGQQQSGRDDYSAAAGTVIKYKMHHVGKAVVGIERTVFGSMNLSGREHRRESGTTSNGCRGPYQWRTFLHSLHLSKMETSKPVSLPRPRSIADRDKLIGGRVAPLSSDQHDLVNGSESLGRLVQGHRESAEPQGRR